SSLKFSLRKPTASKWNLTLASKNNGSKLGLEVKMQKRFSTSSSKTMVRPGSPVRVWKSGMSEEVSSQLPAELVTGSTSTLESKTRDRKTRSIHSTECGRNWPTENQSQL